LPLFAVIPGQLPPLARIPPALPCRSMAPRSARSTSP